ncbi:MAG: 4'-phosphopantetheinyl transferase superfamily protein [Gammaproteobacteria bacterium]|nr:4'-phosphopantetheinyl transferase superfamily protein [Gammaproteobacteria bacterium]
MLSANQEVEHIEKILRPWFDNHVFLKASRIGSYPLFVEEQQLIDGAVLSRRNEFSTGRWLARQGLRQFGLTQQAIEMGRLRNPIWPEPVLGSITHDADYCAVVMMEHAKHRELGIGIDLVNLPQRKEQLNGLGDMISSDRQELKAVSQLNPVVDPLLILFSIKESIIKALSFWLTEFIDMRSIQISSSNQLTCTLDDYRIDADIYAATSADNLVTAAKIYRIGS